MKNWGVVWPIALIFGFAILFGAISWHDRQNKIRMDFRKSFYCEYPTTDAEREVVKPEVVKRMNLVWNIVIKAQTRTQSRMAVDEFLSTIVDAEHSVRQFKAPRRIRKQLNHLFDTLDIEATLVHRKSVTQETQKHLKRLTDFYSRVVKSAYDAGFEEETLALPFVNRE